MMEKSKKIYKQPTDTQPIMASESLATYSATSSPEHILLTIPPGVDAQNVREKINAYFDLLLKDCILEQEFRKHLDKWLLCTGMFSGPNLCWDNEPFRQLESMGQITLQMFDKVCNEYPDYTHRHIGWLRTKLCL